jgi:hypothetical protein
LISQPPTPAAWGRLPVIDSNAPKRGKWYRASLAPNRRILSPPVLTRPRRRIQAPPRRRSGLNLDRGCRDAKRHIGNDASQLAETEPDRVVTLHSVAYVVLLLKAASDCALDIPGLPSSMMSRPRISPQFGPRLSPTRSKNSLVIDVGRKCTRASSGSIPGDEVIYIFDLGEACAVLLAILPFHSHMRVMTNLKERQRGELSSFHRPRFHSFFSA